MNKNTNNPKKLSNQLKNTIRDLSKLPEVEYVEPDNLGKPATYIPNDLYTGNMTVLNNVNQYNDGGKPGVDMNMFQAWDITKGSASTVVAVIDTGVDVGLPDFGNKIWTNPGEIAGNGIDDDGNSFIDDVHGWNFVSNNADLTLENLYHGDNMAGLIGAATNNSIGVPGICPQCTIMPLKWNGTGAANTSYIINSLTYAQNKGAKVINMSIAVVYSAALETKVNEVYNAGIYMVAAAGNENSQSTNYPASYPNVFSTAAINDRGVKIGYSSYGI